MEGRYVLDFDKGDCPVVVSAIPEKDQWDNRCKVLTTTSALYVKMGADTCGRPAEYSVLWEDRKDRIPTCAGHVDGMLSYQKVAKKE